jgi:hypothetical protein
MSILSFLREYKSSNLLMSSSSPPKTARRIRADEQKRLERYMKNKKTKSSGSGVATTLSSAFGRTAGDPKKREQFYRDLFSVDIVTPLYCAFDPQNFGKYNRYPINSQNNSFYELKELQEKLHTGFNDSKLYAQIGCYIQDLVFCEVTDRIKPSEYVVQPSIHDTRVLPALSSLNKDESSDIYVDGIFSEYFGKDFNNERSLFVIHAGDRDSNIGLTNEAIVGLYALNELRDFFPTFQYIYAAFRAPAFIDGEPLRDGNYYSTYTLVETLEECRPLDEWIEEYGDEGDFEKIFALVLFQVFAAIGFANKKYGFSHNNLKMSNIFVRNVRKKTTLIFGKFMVETEYIVKIANFTQSRIMKGEHGLETPTGKFDEANGYSPYRSNNLVDFLNLLTEICMYRKSIEVSSILGILPGSIKIKTSENTEVIFLLKLLTETNLKTYIDIMTGEVQRTKPLRDMIMETFLDEIKPNSVKKHYEVGNVACKRVNPTGNILEGCTDLGIDLGDLDKTNENERNIHRKVMNNAAYYTDEYFHKEYFPEKVDRINADLNKIKKNEAQRSFTSYFWNSNREQLTNEIIQSQEIEAIFGPLRLNDKNESVASIIQKFRDVEVAGGKQYSDLKKVIVTTASAVIALALLVMSYAGAFSALQVSNSSDGFIVLSVVPDFARDILAKIMAIPEFVAGLGSSAYELVTGALNSAFSGMPSTFSSAGDVLSQAAWAPYNWLANASSSSLAFMAVRWILPWFNAPLSIIFNLTSLVYKLFISGWGGTYGFALILLRTFILNMIMDTARLKIKYRNKGMTKDEIDKEEFKIVLEQWAKFNENITYPLGRGAKGVANTLYSAGKKAASGFRMK